ncbi:MAG: bacteriophage holin [Candidatus Omnitrophota bacterium]|nr:bacteriophage holin [Candidatus Omnitrophota bacterium]
MNTKLSPRALAFAGGVLWGVAVLLVGLANLKWPGYGQAFLEIVSSIYPGYHVGPNVGSVLIGAGYAIVDGAVGGALLAWLYNLSLCCPVFGKKST